ncbi:uncharacterized protein LOC143920474 [Arctopsyche grandis]|uniref:uncharacterized protein LOC143920474 n=1 Tax=Arctopsyche grandis TaxID=121162 RepID=UPI00406DA206
MAKVPTNFMDTFLPFYKILKVFGMAPFSINHKNNKYSLKCTTISTLYSICIFLYACFFNLLSKHKSVIKSYSDENELTVILITTQRYYMVIVGSLSISQNILKRNKIISFLSSMMNIDEKLKQQNIEIPYERQKKYTKMMSLSLTIFISTVLIVVEALYWLQKKSASSNYGLKILRSLSEMVIVLNLLNVIQILMVVRLVKSRFELVNTALNKLKLNLHMTSHLEVMKENNKKFKSCVDKISPGKLESIESLCDIHNDLCKVAVTVNDICGMHMLLLIAGVFVSHVSRLYMAVMRMDSEMKHDASFIYLGKSVLWIIIYDGLTLIILENSNEITEELKLISIKLVRQQVNFTVFGMFAFNKETFCSIIGSVVTYFVVMLQFQNNSLTFDFETQ